MKRLLTPVAIFISDQKIFPAREAFLRALDDFFAAFAPSRFITLPKNGYNQPDRAAGRGHF
jgi:hypothetical protein